jgi:hypothetical protein
MKIKIEVTDSNIVKLIFGDTTITLTFEEYKEFCELQKMLKEFQWMS